MHFIVSNNHSLMATTIVTDLRSTGTTDTPWPNMIDVSTTVTSDGTTRKHYTTVGIALTTPVLSVLASDKSRATADNPRPSVLAYEHNNSGATTTQAVNLGTQASGAHFHSLQFSNTNLDHSPYSGRG